MDGRPNPFASRGGVALRSDLLAAGYDDRDLRQRIRLGAWVRIRRGAYAEASVWNGLDESGRHLLRCRAVGAVLGPSAVLSHSSAAVVHGLPVWGVDLDVVHVTRAQHGQSRHEAGVVHHVATLAPDEVCQVDGVLVTSLTRSVVDLARTHGFEAGVVTADAALHRGVVTPAELLACHLRTDDWPGSRVVGRVLGFADPRPESVGESRTRVLFLREGLPTPRPQVSIFRGSVLLGRVDFYVDEARTAVEFDGRTKYRVPPGADARVVERVLWAEKRREDAIRELGHEFVRVTWGDLEHAEATAQRLRAAFARGRLRRDGLTA